MKIENKGIVITGVPLIESITVVGEDTIIQIAGGPPLVYDRAGLTELSLALGAALGSMPHFPASESSEPRIWNAGDEEPEGVIAVIDDDGDRWVKGSGGGGGWSWGNHFSFWEDLLNSHGPLTEDK